MNKISSSLLLLLLIIVGFVSCKKTDTVGLVTQPVIIVDSCVGITVLPVVDVSNTITAQALGTITVKSPIGSGITYSVGGAFQSSTNFFNLASGNFTVTVKTSAGCVGTKSVSINATGAKFYEVRKIVNGYCGPCHLNGTISGGRNYDADSSIVAAWSRIKIRTNDGIPSFMPQSGQITAPDKQKILDWVNAGHRVTD